MEQHPVDHRFQILLTAAGHIEALEALGVIRQRLQGHLAVHDLLAHTAVIAAVALLDELVQTAIRFQFQRLAETQGKGVHIRRELADVDIVVGSVLVPGDKAPHLITKDMLKLMEPGTVLVDVAIDQGGCFETSHPTTHSDPTYMVDGIVHYAVANIPGAVPNTSTTALTNATLKYALALADKGWRKACKEDKALYRGLNIVNGKVVFKAVADVFGLEYEEMIL